MYYPIDYDYPLFRPPSEGHSIIFQITKGCSWNRCIFCEMYKTKNFKVKSFEVIKNEIESFKGLVNNPVKIFLADGDAFILSTEKLLKIIDVIKSVFPKIQRISAYALPKNINSKSNEELKQLYDAGLKLLYIGLESGDDELLKIVNKGETFNSSLDAMLKLKLSGIKSSVMILNGLGGKNYSTQHAENSIILLNKSQPEYFSTLVLSFPYGESKYRELFGSNYESMQINDLLKELLIMIKKSELENSIFRSDHASNYLVLKGILNKDKGNLIETITKSLSGDNDIKFREEWQRGL